MYDPLVVDAFVSSLDSLKATVESDTFATLITQKSGRPTVVAHPSHTDSDRAMVLESLELLAAMAPFPPGRAAMGTARDALSLVQHIAPFDTSVLFVCDSQSLELRPLHTEGPSSQSVREMAVPFAERLTGWVAAYRTSVWNSDAALDIDASFRPSNLVLASAIPLVCDDSILGVLTLYGRNGQEISLVQRRALIEGAGPSISESLSEALRRGRQGIDGRRIEVRTAGLAALESALSHSDQGNEGAVMIARLRAVSNDGNRQLHVSTAAGLQLLVASVLAHDDSRQCLVLSDDCCLIYEGQAESKQGVAARLLPAISVSPMQPFSLELVPVTTSLELQMFVRRILERDDAISRDRSGTRVH